MNTIRNLSLCAALVISTIWSSQVKGQTHIPYINAADSIELGIDYADTGAFIRAIPRYEVVSESDTNYPLALIEDAIAQEGAENDSTAIAMCRKGITLESQYTSDFYTALANSYEDEGDYTDAVNFLRDTALVKYPNMHTYYSSIGMSEYKMHKYGEAIDAFEKAIDMDMFDANSHYYLARCCLEQGRLVPALLSLQFYLLLQHDKNRSFTVIQLMEQMVENKYQYNKKYAANPDTYHDSAFMVIDPLIRSQIAMNKQYIETTKVHYKFVRQLQLLFEQLKYVPNTGNYWMEKYVPIFTGIQQNGYLEPYLYFVMETVERNDPQMQKDADKERKKINKFVDWANDKLTTQRNKREMVVDGKKGTFDCEYWDNGMTESVGHKNSKGMYTGECTYYYRRNGALLSHGSCNDKGERNGKWRWYYVSGILKEEDNFVNGKKEDTAKIWHENGALKGTYIYHNDILDGAAMEYNYSGILTAKAGYKAGELDGETTLYYSDGKLHYTATYVKGKLQGELKEYFPSGTLRMVKLMKDSKKEGAYTSYSWNGKTYQTGQYKDDNQVGDWKWYYADGRMEKEGNLNQKGNLEGRWLFYYRNGNKEETEIYNKNGKEDGVDSMYDKDGVLYQVVVFKDGVKESCVYKDKNGNVVSDEKANGNTFNYTGYSPQGIRTAEGTYTNGKKDGVWKYYNFYGKLDATYTYNQDSLSGPSVDYFFNGKVKDSVYYKHDEKDGYAVNYYINGKMDVQGWYKEGSREGDWLFYDLKGTLTKHDYYMGGSLYGHVDFLENNGKISEKDMYKYGYLDKVLLYDSGQNLYYTYTSDKGNGKFLSKYSNGNPLHEINFVNGVYDGPSKRYSYDGKLTKDCSYLLDNIQGADKGYYDNGNLKYTYTCDNDNFQDTARTYYKDGRPEEISEYYDDELDGLDKCYYENGKLDYVCNYSEGELDGEYHSYYGENMPNGVVWYTEGNVVAYASVGADGKPSKRTEMDSGTGQLVCYYPNGNKSILCDYYNGVLVGKRMNYGPDGKVSADESFESGRLNGVQKYYYDSTTTLKKADNYYYGEEDGTCTYYYSNGKIKREETYVLGTLNGPAREYDEDGNLVKIIYYYDGNEISETKPQAAKPQPKPKPKTTHIEKKNK